MNKKQSLLKHLTEDIYVRIQKSKVHGVGLIAIRDIPKGTNPFKSMFSEDHVEFNKSELNHLPEEIQKMIHDYCAEEDDKVWIPNYGFNPIHVLHLINHSETPNVKTIDDGTTFVTIRDIKKGEELLSNYATYDTNYDKKM